MKKCPKCNNEYGLTNFWKDRTKKDGYSCYCIECDKIRQKTWQTKYPEKMRTCQKNWGKNNPEKVKAQKQRGYQKSQLFMDKIKESLGCQLCRETEKSCLDFHHLYKKDFEITH